MLLYPTRKVSRHELPRNPGRMPGRRNRGPLGSAEERRRINQGESEHVRAHGCASCAAALIRRAPQGTGRAGCAAGADAGWFSLGYFSLTIQREVTRPSGRNAFALEARSEKSKRQTAKGKKQKAKSKKQKAKSKRRRAHGCASCAPPFIRGAPHGTGRAAGADARWLAPGYFSSTIRPFKEE